MLTAIDVKFTTFDSARLGLFSSENILQIADVALWVSSKGATLGSTNQKGGFRSRGTNWPISEQNEIMWPVNQI